MRAKIIKIGNSRGIRIPSPLLKESGLENDVELSLSSGGLTVRPVRTGAISTDETTRLSEMALAKDWNRPEEDEAWAHL